jgi:hypothetical protein
VKIRAKQMGPKLSVGVILYIGTMVSINWESPCVGSSGTYSLVIVASWHFSYLSVK